MDTGIYKYASDLNHFIGLFSDPFFIRMAILGIKVDYDGIAENLRTLYEWEYKYHKIKNSQKTNPERRENLLNYIERELEPVALEVISKLLYVFGNWVRNHNVEELDEMAEERIHSLERMYEEEGTGWFETKTYIYRFVKDEYERFVGGNFESELIEESIPYLGPNLRYLKEDLLVQKYDEIDDYEEGSEEEAELKKEIEYLEEYDLSSEEGLLNFYQEYGSDYLYGEGELFFVENEDFIDMMINFYRNNLVQHLSDHFLNNPDFPDYIETLDRNKEIFEKLANTRGKSFGEMFVDINRALNAVHNTGSMLDYIAREDYEVDEDFLDEMSNIDTTEWDNELVRDMGVWLQ